MAQSLFRSIRHKLLNEGKLLRYLTYAVGEVVLIIVGILMALSISDWNEDRKAEVELDAYVEQLRNDVEEAIENLQNTIRINNGFKEGCEFVPAFLKLSDYVDEDLARFEKGLSNLGSYDEANVHVGVLGELMDGNKELISRNPELTQAARNIEGILEESLSNLGHIYNQIDLDASRINDYRGKGFNQSSVRPKYDLEQLRSANEFIYTTHTITSRLRAAELFSERIKENLNNFLTTLEEY